MNNRKQKIESILDSLTQKELDTYIKDRNISLENNKMFQRLKSIKKPESHFIRIAENIHNDVQKGLDSYFKLGEAWIIAFIFVCFYDDKYKIKDLKTYLHALFKNDSELKDMVYDCMKDW